MYRRCIPRLFPGSVVENNPLRLTGGGVVPEAGLEPARPRGQGILNPSCLPISSLWHGVASLQIFAWDTKQLAYFEVWLVKPEGHTFDYQYWMKFVDITLRV